MALLEEDNKKQKQTAKNQKTNASYNDLTQKALNQFETKTAAQQEQYGNQENKDLFDKSATVKKDNAQYNVNSINQQYKNQKRTYDIADKQNENLANLQQVNARKKSETERFQAQRNLQNAALGLFGSMNQAMNGSTTGNVMSMLKNRNDNENVNYWQQLTDNLNSIWDAYDEAHNQNQISRMDAKTNAKKGMQDVVSEYSQDLGNLESDYDNTILSNHLNRINNEANSYKNSVVGRRQIQGDLSAYLNNIDPDLYQNPQDIWSPNAGSNNFNTGKKAKTKAYENAAEQFKKEINKELKNLNMIYKGQSIIDQTTGKPISIGNNIEVLLKSQGVDFDALKKGDPERFFESVRRLQSSPAAGRPIKQIATTILNIQNKFEESLDATKLNSSENYGTSKAFDLFNKGYGAINKDLYDTNLINKNDYTYYEDPNKIKIGANKIDTLQKSIDSTTAYDPYESRKKRIGNYLMPAVPEAKVENKTNKLGGNDYFSNLVNGYNNRR